eukprot:CAMPEP_0197029428 /NCGR_PEP_ID=MMETSP1384-20130603/8870_1 /TAXON_ID=29189 /ORGANISM="Ammonia sp." /LENGTH=388 /DNA_ID=CAMNT_0042458589 /DNA_START=32 /DNA_END=1198 /DNA_ORIENTATION=+
MSYTGVNLSASTLCNSIFDCSNDATAIKFMRFAPEIFPQFIRVNKRSENSNSNSSSNEKSADSQAHTHLPHASDTETTQSNETIYSHDELKAAQQLLNMHHSFVSINAEKQHKHVLSMHVNDDYVDHLAHHSDHDHSVEEHLELNGKHQRERKSKVHHKEREKKKRKQSKKRAASSKRILEMNHKHIHRRQKHAAQPSSASSSMSLRFDAHCHDDDDEEEDVLMDMMMESLLFDLEDGSLLDGESKFCLSSQSLRYRLKEHVLRHTHRNEHDCDGEDESEQNNIYSLIELKCIKCNKQFKQKRLYDEHRCHGSASNGDHKLSRNRKEKEKPFKCRHCDLYFGSKSSRSKHEPIHNGARRYKCKFCHKAYIQQWRAKRHQAQCLQSMHS